MQKPNDGEACVKRLSFHAPVTYEYMMEVIDLLAERYACLHVTELGTSILGKRIPMIHLGQGKKTVLYVGAHHGMEWLTSALLLKFADEYGALFETNGRIGHTTISYLNATRTITLVPMLNPDGVNYQIEGISEDNPLRERLEKMNPGGDFSTWQANARGVDLNHNYAAGFAEYLATEDAQKVCGGAASKWCGEGAESEPESGALANYARFGRQIEMYLSFHSQGEEIYYGDRYSSSERNRRIGQILAAMSGYTLCRTEGSAAYGGFTDWVVSELGKPSFTIECGRGTNPLPLTSLFEIYYKLRRMLFEAPMII